MLRSGVRTIVNQGQVREGRGVERHIQNRRQLRRTAEHMRIALRENARWRMRVPKDGRTIGVIVHHVASVYPLEIELAQKLAAGRPITGVTMKEVDAMNARHAIENSEVTKEEALSLLGRNSAVAAAAIRTLSDDALAAAAPVSLYGDAPPTCQFPLEDHAMRHSYHHMSVIAQALRMGPVSTAG